MPQVISVFTELEQQPVIFRTSINAATPATVPAACEAAEVAPAHQLGAAATLRPAGGSNGSWRRRQPKTAKLIGMVGVVALSVSLTAVLYSATGGLARDCGALVWLEAKLQLQNLQAGAGACRRMQLPCCSVPHGFAAVLSLRCLALPLRRHPTIHANLLPSSAGPHLHSTGFMGYLAFPHPQPDILLSFDPEDKLMQVGPQNWLVVWLVGSVRLAGAC